MTQEFPEQPKTRSIPLSHFVLFWSIALAGASFDLSTKSYFFAWLGEPYQRPPVTVIRNVLELQTSYNTGALWGLGRAYQHSSTIFAGLSIVAAVGICYWLFVLGAARDRRLTIAPVTDHGRRPGQLLRSTQARACSRLCPPAHRRDQFRLRDLQLRRQHAGRRCCLAGLARPATRRREMVETPKAEAGATDLIIGDLRIQNHISVRHLILQVP